VFSFWKLGLPQNTSRKYGVLSSGMILAIGNLSSWLHVSHQTRIFWWDGHIWELILVQWCYIYIYLKKFRYILYWAEPDALHLVDYCPSVSKYSKVGWLGHLMHQIVPEMTYNVSSGTLNPTVLSADHSDIIILCSGTWFVQFLFIGGKCMQTLNWEDKNIWRLQFKCGLKKRLCSMHTGICL